MDWKVECGQLNLAHVARNKKYRKKKLIQTNASANVPVVQYRFKIREGSLNGTMQKNYEEGRRERICGRDECFGVSEWVAS